MSAPERMSEPLAWLHLLEAGRLVRSQASAAAWDLARDAGWAELTGRRGELVLREAHRGAIEARLDQLWPTWRADAETLRSGGEPPTLAGWQRLAATRRRAHLPGGLPASLNRRTLAAALREHSKVALGVEDHAAVGGTAVTHDNLLRMRPHAGLTLAREGASLDANALVALCGEVCVTERALRAGTRLAGQPPRALLLVENLGVYVDVPLPVGWCAVHVPGWNTRMVAHLWDAWPGTPALIFGDLDPNGVAIARALQAAWPGLRWFVPDFALDYLPRAREGRWPEDRGDMPPVVRELMEAQRWIEQEVFVLDARLEAALERALGGG